MAAEDANLRNWRFGTLGDLAARVRNYASRGRESANYGGAILLGLTALEWEEGAQHSAHWRFVTLYSRLHIEVNVTTMWMISHERC